MLSEFEAVVAGHEGTYPETASRIFEVDLHFRLPPDLSYIAELLWQVNRRMHVAVGLAFLPETAKYLKDLNPETLAKVLSAPLRIKRLSAASLRVTIEGDPDEISRVLGSSKPTPQWRKRLYVALAVLFGVSGASVTPGGSSYGHHAQSLRQQVDDMCGQLPTGSEVTLTFVGQELKIPCNAPPSETKRYRYEITLSGGAAENQRFLEHLRKMPGVERQSRFIKSAEGHGQKIVLFAETQLSERFVRDEAKLFHTGIADFSFDQT